MTHINYNIDYLQFTTNLPPKYMPLDGMENWTRSYMKMYKRMRKCANGAHFHIGNPNSDRTLVLLAGKACENIGVDSGYVTNLLHHNANVTRIDLAMTTDYNVLPMIMRDSKSIQSNLWQGMKAIVDHEYTEQTIYIGDMAKRGKKGIVRAYDKALQLGLDDLRAYRIETEIRHKHAHICSKRIANGETIASVMNSKFFIDKKWYRDLLGSDISTSRFKDLHKEEIAPIDAKMQWLMRAVTPTLQYVIDYDKANGTSNFASILEKLNFD